MVIFDNVSKVYNQSLEAVKNLNLTVDKGKLVTLIGPSGCGKTTTLKMVNRIIEPTSGTIFVNGKDIRKVDPIKLRRGIGYVIQQIGLFPNMTIAQNITVVGKLLGWPKQKCLQRASELLELVQMEPDIYLSRFPKELSGGQQQRIGVLRALAAEPDIILMDEPFGALDPITREQLQGELKTLQEQLRKTILFVTHDMDEALTIADVIVLMKDGVVVQEASPEEILRNPANSFVTSFIGKDRLLRSPDQVLVAEVMINDPITIQRSRGLAEALEHMRKKRVDSLMVIDNSKVLHGVVTFHDIHKAMDTRRLVGDIAKKQFVTVRKEQTVREAVYLMSTHDMGYLPVVDDNNKLQGLMTRASLVDVLNDVLWSDSDDNSKTETSTAERGGFN